MKRLLAASMVWMLGFNLLILSGCGAGGTDKHSAPNSEVTTASLSISPTTPSILLGGTQQFTATATYSDNSTADVTSSVAWTSSNTSSASINDTGLATGVGVGSSTIGASLDGKTKSTVITVTASAVAPSITTQPADQAVSVGQTATFSVAASGTAPLNYQWKKNGANVGSNASSYTTPATTLTDNGASFTVVVSNSAGNVTSAEADLNVTALPSGTVHIIFLHHSTGEYVYNEGVADYFTDYNTLHGTQYQFNELWYPSNSYAPRYSNYPYDYWNLWVDHQGSSQYGSELNLDQIAPNYDVIVFKHCYPVSEISEDNGNPDVTSAGQTIANYQLQYAALKTRMRQFPTKKFILWTGAALNIGSTNAGDAQRAQAFFNWVKDTWDEDGDNIFIWDFYALETEGDLYMNDAYDSGTYDPHPNESFSSTVAPYFAQRVIDVIEGRGDTGSITGH